MFVINHALLAPPFTKRILSSLSEVSLLKFSFSNNNQQAGNILSRKSAPRLKLKKQSLSNLLKANHFKLLSDSQYQILQGGQLKLVNRFFLNEKFSKNAKCRETQKGPF